MSNVGRLYRSAIANSVTIFGELSNYHLYELKTK
jgi:hypothetical protein